jgi:hypothetical protein
LIFQAREQLDDNRNEEADENVPQKGTLERKTDIRSKLPRVSSVKDRISELEQRPKRKRSSTQAVKINSRAGLVLNLANQFESATFTTRSKSSSNFLDASTLNRASSFDTGADFAALQNQPQEFPSMTNSKPPIARPATPRSDTQKSQQKAVNLNNQHNTEMVEQLVSRRYLKTQQHSINCLGEVKSLETTYVGNPNIAVAATTTDVSIVPQGTVLKTKEKMESLKRTPVIKQTI